MLKILNIEYITNLNPEFATKAMGGHHHVKVTSYTGTI